MNNHSLIVIDPAIANPSIESFNRISKIAPISATYHLPALFGTYSLLEEYNKNTKGISKYTMVGLLKFICCKNAYVASSYMATGRTC